MGKSGKKAGKRLTKKELVDRLTAMFLANVGTVYSLKDISRELNLTTHPLKMLCADILNDMTQEGFLIEQPYGSFRFNSTSLVFEGQFVRKSNGKNSVIPDDGSEPVFVAERNSLHAMNGDTVKVSLSAFRKGHTKEGAVIEIVKRAKDTFVGKLQVNKQYAFLLTESANLANDIFIPMDKLAGGKNGDKALVRVVEWPTEAKNPIGEVIDILGEAGDNNAEMHAILAEYGLPYKYPEAVEAAADKISAEITDEDYAEREDFRDVTTFTIDPHDAKDFDDALSIRSIGDGLWEVGVHIADVSHYVKEGDIIDREAVERATSIYLVDRTIPMLPERLCNFICSLRPDEEKLAYSCIFTITDKGDVKDYRIVHTVIKSNRRFTYEEAQAILEANGSANPEDLKIGGSAIKPDMKIDWTEKDGLKGEYALELVTLNRLAKIFREKRFSNGAIDFDRCEVRFDIDEKGKPVSVYFKYAKDANKLVEEFMLLANRTVAEHIGRVPKGKTAKVFPYRIHDLPDPDKLDNLCQFVGQFNYKLKTTGSKTDVAKNINKLLSEVKGKREQGVVEIVALRTMQKARYSTHNCGHYGLAFDYYTHFTSPIRRYPDTMVHRLLTKYANGERSVSQTKYEDLCEHSSAMEQLAASAERASIKYKQVEFMSERMGQEFDGTISGVTEWGLYVECNENKCEGMIPMRELDDDYYEFDERNYCIRGRRTHRIYTLGDPVRIKVAKANLERKQLDFEIVHYEGEEVRTTPFYTGKKTSLTPKEKIANHKKAKKDKKGHSKSAGKKGGKKKSKH